MQFEEFRRIRAICISPATAQMPPPPSIRVAFEQTRGPGDASHQGLSDGVRGGVNAPGMVEVLSVGMGGICNLTRISTKRPPPPSIRGRFEQTRGREDASRLWLSDDVSGGVSAAGTVKVEKLQGFADVQVTP